MDHGTENVLMATTQIALRSLHGDHLSGEMSIRYGKCTTNNSMICLSVLLSTFKNTPIYFNFLIENRRAMVNSLQTKESLVDNYV